MENDIEKTDLPREYDVRTKLRIGHVSVDAAGNPNGIGCHIDNDVEYPKINRYYNLKFTVEKTAYKKVLCIGFCPLKEAWIFSQFISAPGKILLIPLFKYLLDKERVNLEEVGEYHDGK